MPEGDNNKKTKTKRKPKKKKKRKKTKRKNPKKPHQEKTQKKKGGERKRRLSVISVLCSDRSRLRKGLQKVEESGLGRGLKKKGWREKKKKEVAAWTALPGKGF